MARFRQILVGKRFASDGRLERLRTRVVMALTDWLSNQHRVLEQKNKVIVTCGS